MQQIMVHHQKALNLSNFQIQNYLKTQNKELLNIFFLKQKIEKLRNQIVLQILLLLFLRVSPNTAPNNNLKKIISKYSFERLIQKHKNAHIAVENAKVVFLPILSTRKAHNKFPKTIPNKYDEPMLAISDQFKSHSDFRIDIIIDINVYNIPLQNSTRPTIDKTLN
ncbi:unnamed protein product [Paramecium sonneborni]|uniref:Uncharacterized protein n=1 Tax=Paramecium sonneborni TaxID=65129 RepID=A0A8S1LMG9_9CILI|nr:unnamed protein product [Paramecium sonneborni]